MLEKLKGEADLKDIPVIMLTAESGKDNVMQIVKLGVKDYMVKPFKGGDLIARVENIMQLVPNPDNDSKSNEGNGSKYFSQVEDTAVLALPAKVTRPVSVEVDGNLQSKLKAQGEPKVNKLTLGLCKVEPNNLQNA